MLRGCRHAHGLHSRQSVCSDTHSMHHLNLLEDLAAAVYPPGQQPLRFDFRQVASVPAEGLWGVVLLRPVVGCVPPASGIKRSGVADTPLLILRLPTHAGGSAACKAHQHVKAGLGCTVSQIGAMPLALLCAEPRRSHRLHSMPTPADRVITTETI
jgi:hypothetical protein